MELIVIIAVFWVVGKILKGVFGGFSKSDYKRDESQVGSAVWRTEGIRMESGVFCKFSGATSACPGVSVPLGCKSSELQPMEDKVIIITLTQNL